MRRILICAAFCCAAMSPLAWRESGRATPDSGKPVPTHLVLANTSETRSERDKDAGPVQAGTNKLALLVGCSEYKGLDRRWKLDGPPNDVKLWRSLLKETFGFDDKNIATLVGNEGDPKAPTYKNIVSGFEDLIKRSDENTQVVILLSGHGSQIPIPETQVDPLDPKNPEPDGLDEIFLPTDIRENKKTGKFEGFIIDDQIGIWLDQLRAKGAHVFIIFDCCHSGTMDRGNDPTDLERSREIKATWLGYTKKEMEAAAKRAADAVAKARAGGQTIVEDSMLQLKPPVKGAKGSVVAFYSAQSFERCPDLPCPPDAPGIQENYYGLLSYNLASIMQQQGKSLNYRELGALLVRKYAAERGQRGPTPYYEGDLSHEVLGIAKWPDRSRIFLNKKTMEVSAGELFGLTKGSILALNPPIGKGDPKEVLGYVKIIALTSTSATVEICEYQNKLAVAKAKIPDECRCTLVNREFGEMKLRYAIAVDDPMKAKLVADAMRLVDKDVQNMLQVVKQPQSEWLILVKKDKEQKKDTIVVRQAQPLANPHLIVAGNALSSPLPEFVLCDDLKQPAEAVARGISRDMSRLFTWQFLWRVASSQSAGDSSESLGLELRFDKIEKNGKIVAPVLHGEPLHLRNDDKQDVMLTLKNASVHNLWISILMMDADYGIQVHSLAINAGGRPITIKGHVNGKQTGREGFIVLAGVIKPEENHRPDLSDLAQSPLRVGEKNILGKRDAKTPFERLMATARSGTGTPRFPLDAPSNPVMFTRSWIIVTPKE